MEKSSQPDFELIGEGHNSNKTADELMQMAKPQEITMDYYALEEPWTLQHGGYSPLPVGDTVEMAAKAMKLIEEI